MTARSKRAGSTGPPLRARRTRNGWRTIASCWRCGVSTSFRCCPISRAATRDAVADGGLQVRWRLGDGGALLLDAQLSDAEARRAVPAGRVIYELQSSPDLGIRLPWSVRWAIAR